MLRIRFTRPARGAKFLRFAFLACFLSASANPCWAINGYFMSGYGPKAVGVGGVGIAMPQDRMAVSANPAGMAFVEPGYDAYIRMMHPQRRGGLDCTGIGACTQGVKDNSARQFFVVPGFGYSKRYNERLTWGIALFANGGINSSFSKAFYDGVAARIGGATLTPSGFPDKDKIGVDYSQLIIAPNISYRLSDRLVFGVAPLLAMHKFSARGFQSFGAFSTDPGSISNRGSNYGVGGGVKFGFIYELTKDLRIGIQYTSKLYMPKLTKYSGLFPNGGELDAPSHYGVGISWDVTEKFTLGVDVHQIQYATVAAFGNHGPKLSEFTGGFANERLYGGDDGVGFGWDNQTVYKAGGIYRFSDRFTFRLGWNRGSSMVPLSEALFSIVAPAGLQNHIYGGMTYAFKSGSEISWGYMHAFLETSSAPTPFFGARATTEVQGDALDISYSRRF